MMLKKKNVSPSNKKRIRKIYKVSARPEKGVPLCGRRVKLPGNKVDIEEKKAHVQRFPCWVGGPGIPAT